MLSFKYISDAIFIAAHMGLIFSWINQLEKKEEGLIFS